MLLWQLFSSFFLIGMFNFGGGYAMVSLIQKLVVTTHGWLTAQEFTNMLAVAESTPGPFAINTATYAGFKVAGLSGAILSNIALILPAFFIIITLASLLLKYEKHWSVQGVLQGLRPVTVALILSSALLLCQNVQISWGAILLAVLAFSLNTWSKIHPVILILGLGLLGMLIVP